MKINVLAMLMVTAMCLSLCSCDGQTETNNHGTDVGLGVSPSTETATSAASKTVTQPGNVTSTTVGKTEVKSERTTRGEQTTTTRALEVLHRGNAIWKEVPIKEGAFSSTGSFSGLDLRETITNADYVFSGTVISRKEYEVSWTSKSGIPWGPYKKSIIEVKVDHDYYGQPPVKGNNIKVYCPYSLSEAFENSVLIKEQGNYVFITKALDEKFVERRKKESPHDQHEQEKYADVYVETPYYNLLPIEKGNVIAYRDYFNWNENIMKKVKPDFETDKISSGNTKDIYIVLDKKDFDSAFLQLFKNPQSLPTAKNMWAWNETTSRRTDEISSKTTAAASRKHEPTARSPLS